MMGSLLVPITLSVVPWMLIPVIAVSAVGIYTVGRKAISFVKPKVERAFSSGKAKFSNLRKPRTKAVSQS